MNNNPESKRFFRRSLLCAIGILLFFFILLIRLFYLQVIENKFYATLSNRNVINVIPVQPTRGLIFDRNGVLLAKNIPIYSLMVIPARVKDLKDTIKKLQTIVELTPNDVQNFYHLAKQYYPYQSVPLKQPLTENEVDSFYVHQYQFPGVSVQTNMLRNYPLGNALSNVVGYVGRINAAELANVNPANYTASSEVGKTGVEKEDEVLLHGTLGSEEAEIDANGKIVRVLKTTAAIPGATIYLTIDSKLQTYAEKLLGKNTGAVVAIQPATGQVLALVTNPNYDPNLFVSGMTTAQYHQIMAAPGHPLFNRALRATYAPGSTAKPFIAFGALNDGVITTKDYIMDPGWYQIPNTKHIFNNWVRKGFGWVNVSKAIMVSCDTFFYQLAYALGIDRLDQALTQFGFGSLTGINLPGERAGIVPTPDWKEKHIGQKWFTGDTVNVGIGQGYITVTPIQLAVATATMAERGLRFQPTVLLKLQQPNGTIINMQPISQSSIVAKDPKSWQTVINAMQTVITNPQGTGYSTFRNVNYTVAGKSGTAQLYASKAGDKNVTTLNDHLFIVFAPVENPQIVIAVVVEHIPGMNERAVQITRQLLDFYMAELKSGSGSANTAPSVALPAPGKAEANSTNTNKPALPAPGKALPTPASINTQTLQQQMDMNMDAQIDMESQLKKEQ
ncbi:MAG: hypothetical protein ACD_42C00271G0001 [uncultured bacterium]|nr:MAG: hypothetical protein ACD_42C00271G0001 [uncultured bacterium]OGT33931.1 MAG: penicillin-binding protein 2 [Gammaproteobacteria bacterium RIFCSPHIGHO2_02_FULL_39_13]OGT50181.1 MAG: penicillin-binding protein 2 [Gammaproteobacteria bacterium RIFCSPHIGHO2_12_FULL_39_24]